MTQDWKCLFGIHHFEILKSEQCYDKKGNNIGYIIVSRCRDCGQITQNTIVLRET